jgi:replicative DNA helicase
MDNFNAPFSQEAEEATIGAVLVNGGLFIQLASFLKNDDFFLLRHNYIWQAFNRIMERNEPIDFVTISEELANTRLLDDIGGYAYLIQLANNTPSSVNAEAYARLVERTSVRRKLMMVADEIKQLALDEASTLDNVISDAEAKLFGVSDTQIKRSFVPMWEALSDYYDRVSQLLMSQGGAVGVPTGFRDLDQLLGGFQKSDLLIFAGRPGMGKCVVGDTLVNTDMGMMTIESLKPKSLVGIPDLEGGTYYPLEIGVQTPTGVQTTSHFFDGGTKPTLTIGTRLGYALSGTHTHPVMVLNSLGEKVWKPLGELVVGDYVAVQRHEPLWGDNCELPKSTYVANDNIRSTKFPALPSRLDENLAYILGLLIGDGGLTHKNSVSLDSADSEIIETWLDFSKRLNLHVHHSNDSYSYRINSVVFYEWLHQLDVSGYSYEKTISPYILQSPKEFVKAFLQGLFDTDAHSESQKGYIQFVTTSKILAKQVHLVLLQFGIVSKLTFKKNNYRGAWLLRITGDATRIFYKEIGFRLTRKQNRKDLLPETSNVNLDVVPYLLTRVSKFSRELNYTRYFRGVRKSSYQTLEAIALHAPEVVPLLQPKFYWDEITSISDNGLQPVYDLVVPNGHAFVANGIVSHNTSFLLTLALNAARVGARIAIFTMEMGVEQIVQRIVAMESAINVQNLRLGRLSPQEQSRFTEVVGRLSNLGIFIDDTPAMSPLDIRTKSRRLAHEHGLDMIIVDYMQLMNAGKGYENNRVQEISYISRSLKELARELNVPLISAAQLSRAVEQRQDKRPVLSDLRESGCIAGDSMVYLADSAEYVPIQALVGKSGFGVLSLNMDTYQLERGEVTNAFCTGTKPIFLLKTALGRTIRATGNHRFLTIDGWRRLDELAIDEHIALPRTMPTLSNQTMPDAELANSDVYWDKIISIQPDGETKVYDLTVTPHSNFVCQACIIHNSIEQDADIVMFLYRDEIYNEATEYPNQADVIVAKHRNGPTGTVSLYFEKSLTKFMDATTHRVDLSDLQ